MNIANITRTLIQKNSEPKQFLTATMMPEEPGETIVKDLKEEKKTFRALINAYNVVDRHLDLIEEGTFVDAAGENPAVVLLWQHRDDQFPVGVIKSITETPVGPVMEFFFADTHEGATLEHLVLIGAVKAVSVGFIGKEYAIYHDDASDTSWQTLVKAELLEVSLVNIPANPGAVILNVEEDLIETKDVEIEETVTDPVYTISSIIDVEGETHLEVLKDGEPAGMFSLLEIVEETVQVEPEYTVEDDTGPAGEELPEDVIDFLRVNGHPDFQENE